MNSRYVQGLEEGIAERSELMAEKFKEQFQGLGPTITNTRGDAEFVAWFLLNVEKQGPDWVTHLDYVAGGKEQVRRFNRIVDEWRGVSDGLGQ